jgi:hypothetical protein
MRQEQMFLVLMGVVEEGEELKEEELKQQQKGEGLVPPLGVVVEVVQLPSLVQVQKQNLQLLI